MSRSALALAALACAAVPGLSPTAVEEVIGAAGDRFQVGFIEDNRGRFWVVRVPRDAVAAAQQDASFGLLAMLARRVPFTVPTPAGFVELPDHKRALVYPLIPGVGLNFATVPSGPGVAVELGRLIAAVHNLDRRVYEEAAVPSYEAEESRRRHLILVDRGAATRRVPSGLLSRWERLLDDVSLWRFAPTPLHGRLEGDHVLARFTDEDDCTTAQIQALVGWERATVGDPAEDFVELVRHAAQETVDTVFEAYAMARTEQPDRRLIERAGLVGELRLLSDFLAAVTSGDPAAVTRAAEALQDLDSQIGDQDAPLAAGAEPLVESVPLNFTPEPTTALYTSAVAATQAVPQGAAQDLVYTSESEPTRAMPQGSRWVSTEQDAPAQNEASENEAPEDVPSETEATGDARPI